MELWIRSQNRKQLFNIKDIEIDDIDYEKIDIKTAFGEILGTYKTKERALEVLDEIHKLLQPKGIIKFKGLLDLETIKKVKEDFENKYLVFGNNVEYFEEPKTIVYEMPKE